MDYLRQLDGFFFTVALDVEAKVETDGTDIYHWKRGGKFSFDFFNKVASFDAHDLDTVYKIVNNKAIYAILGDEDSVDGVDVMESQFL